jgi:DNA invertase Pin-like site-specific DNA recombinase
MSRLAIALCRVSTKKQLDDGNLAPQILRINKAAELLGVSIVKSWELAASSRKGKNVKRKDIVEMYSFCRKNKRVKYLIVDEVDRFMRSIKEYYFWIVKFEEIGVQVRRADKPLVDPNDESAVFDEMIDVYRAESSNNERINKTPEKQMSKMRAGYYTFKPLPGYMTSGTPSLHIIDPHRFYILQRAFKAVADRKLTPNQALKRMTEEGYRTVNGCRMDMARFRQLMVKPYYAGIIQVSNWEVATKNGLHEHMITKAEHQQLLEIASGKKKKFVVNKKNPSFPLNETCCYDCQQEHILGGKVTGYRNHNGTKDKNTGERRYYYRYRCRGCKTYFTREQLHELVSKKLDNICLDSETEQILIDQLKKVWKANIETNVNKISQLQARIHVLKQESSAMALSYATADNEAIKSATEAAMETNNERLKELDAEITRLGDVDSEMESFIEYSIGYTENLRSRYWTLDWDKRKKCELLLFPEGFYVNRQRKVYTPKLSPLYRYKNSPSYSATASNLVDGGPSETRTHDTLLKRQVL